MVREHPAVNNAVRGRRRCGIPIVCLTADLPSLLRSSYVGNDQHIADSVAAQLMGNARFRVRKSVPLVVSAAFRCQQEREIGFRRVLRFVNQYPMPTQNAPRRVQDQKARHQASRPIGKCRLFGSTNASNA